MKLKCVVAVDVLVAGGTIMSALLSARTKLSIIHNWENAAGSCLQHTDNLIFTGDSFYRQPTEESPVCLCLNNIYTFYLLDILLDILS